jgi:hypothetical protein
MGVLDQITERGELQTIRCDNGPELTSVISWPGVLKRRSNW